MASLSRKRIRDCLDNARDGLSTSEQGKALEDLICYIFGKVPGIEITQRNRLNAFHSEEIDVALWNNQHPQHFAFLPNIILVESKNWSQPVGSSEVSWFDRKLQSRGLNFGILVAFRGITGSADDLTSAHKIIADSLRDQRRIVVLTVENFESLSDTSQLVVLMKQKLCELAVNGTSVP